MSLPTSVVARLAPLYPDKLMVGMEIRDKVATYVRERIGAWVLLAHHSTAASQDEVAACTYVVLLLRFCVRSVFVDRDELLCLRQNH